MAIHLKPIRHLAVLLAAALLTCGPAHAQALSSSKDEIAYRVRPGDTLLGLGERYFVSKDSYLRVARVNGLADPNRLRVGSTILIPTAVLRFSRPEAKIIAFTGRASIASAGQLRPVAMHERLLEGAIVETAENGYVTLQLANGSRISLPSKSRMRIARMRTHLLTGGADLDFVVERGRTETSATPLPDDRSRFRMRTPVAISAVRGTVFRVGYEGPGSASLTEVVEGTVAVNLGATGAQTTLPRGFGAAGLPGGNLKREELLSPPEYEPGSEYQRAREVAFALKPQPGAVGYLIQIARDAEFSDLVGAARSAEPTIVFGALPTGHYYVRAMAIAPSGLIGMPRTAPFERNLQSLTARRTGRANGNWLLEWDLGQSAGNVYHLQLFEVGNRAVPIIDEPGLKSRSMTIQGLPAGKYEWRVGVSRAQGGTIQETWTGVETFTVVK